MRRPRRHLSVQREPQCSRERCSEKLDTVGDRTDRTYTEILHTSSLKTFTLNFTLPQRPPMTLTHGLPLRQWLTL